MREIAIFTDVHGLVEPLKAILNDIKKRGIKEIYSLGDNIGAGPSVREILDLIKENNVISIAGNNEYYCTIGIAPFRNFFTSERIANQNWINSKLTEEDLHDLLKYPSSIDLTLGNKKIALCHFANDIRIDYTIHGTYTYQDEIKYGNKAYLQFLYTNSDEQKRDIIKNKDNSKEFYDGFRSSYHNPLFNGKNVLEYDYIFQGHVHFPSIVSSPTTIFYTVGMAYCKENIATYIILKEKEDGFDIEEVYVTFDRKKMLDCVKNSDMPDKSKINKYLRQ